MSLLFNMLSRLVITFLPRSKRLLISWLQSPSTVILEPKKIKSVTVSIVSPSICHEVMGPGAMILVFWMLSFKPDFSCSSFTFIKRLSSSSSLSAKRVVWVLYHWATWEALSFPVLTGFWIPLWSNAVCLWSPPSPLLPDCVSLLHCSCCCYILNMNSLFDKSIANIFIYSLGCF